MTETRPNPSSVVKLPDSGGSSLAAHPGGDTHIGEVPQKEKPRQEKFQPQGVRNDQATVISQGPPIGADQVSPADGQGLIGQRLEHFVLEELVGGGGMGVVFRATDTRLNRVVALKILARDEKGDLETVRRFRNEAQSAARLEHENIARVYHVGEDRGLNFIVFEFIDGINLRDLVSQRGALPLDEALNYTVQVARALVHASGREVVHRDIKPSNVLVTHNRLAKLVDMGLARLHDVEHSNDLTATGVTLGTFDYISPEQARDPRNADVRSDIYSLGCTLFFMLTARPPFPEGTALQKMLQHQGDTPPDPREFNAAVPDEVVRILRKMLAKDPRRRYQDPSVCIEEIQRVADDMSIEIYHSGPAVPIRQLSPVQTLLRQHLPWVVPAALLVAAVFLLDQLLPSSAVDNEPKLPPAPPLVQRNATDSSPSEAGDPKTAGDTNSGAGSTLPGAAQSGASTSSDGSPPEKPVEVAPSRGVAVTEIAATPPDGDSTGLSIQQQAGLTVAPVSGSLGENDTQQESLSTQTVAALDATQIEEPLTSTTSPPPAVTEGVLVVNPASDGETPHEYKTLADACEHLQNGWPIELRYNGPKVERPIKIKSGDVTIRAGQGYQPEIAFRPTSLDLDEVTYPRNMITVSSGRLRLLGVAVTLDLPLTPASGRWNMFSLKDSELDLSSACWLTISNSTDSGNAYHDQVNFIHVSPGAAGETMMIDGSLVSTEREPVRIHLQDCLARGEGVFLYCEGRQPVELDWQNGLLATSEVCFKSVGGPMQPRPTSGRHKLRLDHVTINAQRGLCVLSGSENYPYQLKTDVDCKNSVIITAQDAALVEQAGMEPVLNQQQRFNWRGKCNAYEVTRVFLRTTNMSTGQGPQELTFDDWTAFSGVTENPPQRRHVQFNKSVPTQVPPHTHRPDDYTLDHDPGISDMARAEADDGRAPGQRPEPLTQPRE